MKNTCHACGSRASLRVDERPCGCRQFLCPKCGAERGFEYGWDCARFVKRRPGFQNRSLPPHQGANPAPVRYDVIAYQPPDPPRTWPGLVHAEARAVFDREVSRSTCLEVRRADSGKLLYRWMAGDPVAAHPESDPTALRTS